jgi:hypothetical protein
MVATTAGRLLAGMTGLLIPLVGCGSDDDREASSTSEQTTTSQQTTTSEQTTTTPLDGTYQTGPITPAEAEATVREHGLEEWLDEFRPLNPIEAPSTELILDIGDGEWDLYGETDGGPRVEIDYDAEYAVEGDQVVFTHSDGANTYQWSLDGDTLTLEFVDSTLPPYAGIPEEVFQSALYETSTFTRQS